MYERNSGLKFFFPYPVLAKNNAEKRFFKIFKIFCNFFPNFLNRVDNERNSGLKFLTLFLGLSHPVLTSKNAGKGFFNFSNFFAFFFRIFLPGSSMNGIGS